jgi:hypothetical protein
VYLITLQFVKPTPWEFPVQNVPQISPVGHVTGHITVSGVTRNALPDVHLSHVMSWTVLVNVRKGIEAVNVTSQVSYYIIKDIPCSISMKF